MTALVIAAIIQGSAAPPTGPTTIRDAYAQLARSYSPATFGQFEPLVDEAFSGSGDFWEPYSNVKPPRLDKTKFVECMVGWAWGRSFAHLKNRKQIRIEYLVKADESKDVAQVTGYCYRVSPISKTMDGNADGFYLVKDQWSKSSGVWKLTSSNFTFNEFESEAQANLTKAHKGQIPNGMFLVNSLDELVEQEEDQLDLKTVADVYSWYNRYERWIREGDTKPVFAAWDTGYREIYPESNNLKRTRKEVAAWFEFQFGKPGVFGEIYLSQIEKGDDKLTIYGVSAGQWRRLAPSGAPYKEDSGELANPKFADTYWGTFIDDWKLIGGKYVLDRRRYLKPGSWDPRDSKKRRDAMLAHQRLKPQG